MANLFDIRSPRLRDLLNLLQLVIACGVVFSFVGNYRARHIQLDHVERKVEDLGRRFDELQSKAAYLELALAVSSEKYQACCERRR